MTSTLDAAPDDLVCAVGSKPIPLAAVVDAVVDDDGSLNDHLIISSLRLPRTLLGLVVGVALGLSGAVMQGSGSSPWSRQPPPGSLAWTNSSVASLSIILDDLERFAAQRPEGFFTT